MSKTLEALCVMSLVAMAILYGSALSQTQQEGAAFSKNHCVTCHSRLTAPLSVSSKYYDWHTSLHRDNGVGCEKCHGGDPTTDERERAHQGVFPADHPESRVHPAHLPETCQACHPRVVASFVESRHYQKLKESNMGPSCATCHEHMAAAVVQSPTEVAALCARCHNTVGGPLPPHPEIPERAQQVMEALNRANGMFVWADRLLEVGQEKKLDVTEEAHQLQAAKTVLSEAKVRWHALEFDVVRKKADQAFEQAGGVKDRLMKLLYPQSVR